MIATPVKTHKITSEDKDIIAILDKYVSNLQENSILAITSKIVSICEGSIIKIENPEDKNFQIPKQILGIKCKAIS